MPPPIWSPGDKLFVPTLIVLLVAAPTRVSLPPVSVGGVAKVTFWVSKVTAPVTVSVTV